MKVIFLSHEEHEGLEKHEIERAWSLSENGRFAGPSEPSSDSLLVYSNFLFFVSFVVNSAHSLFSAPLR